MFYLRIPLPFLKGDEADFVVRKGKILDMAWRSGRVPVSEWSQNLPPEIVEDTISEKLAEALEEDELVAAIIAWAARTRRRVPPLHDRQAFDALQDEFFEAVDNHQKLKQQLVASLKLTARSRR